MAYLMIQNKGEIPLSGIRLLGLSTKTPDKIGQFGTGLKEAICLLKRKGVQVIIFTGVHRISFLEDNQGEIGFCILGPEPSEEFAGGTQPHLSEQFPNDKLHGMGVHVNFGKHDWTEMWQALREFYCNAIDAGKWEESLVETSVQGVKGTTRIYIELTGEVLSTRNELPVRLLAMTNRLPVYSHESGKCYTKIGEKPKVYVKGVYIQESEVNGLFDYELPGLQLNESRSADWYECYQHIARIITSDSAILHKVMEFSQTKEWDQSVEKHAISYFGGGSRSTWLQAFNLFGERAIAITTKHQQELVSARGYSAIPVGHDIYDSMKRHGAQTAASVIGEDESEGCQFEMVPTDVNKFANKLWAKLVELHVVGGHMERPRLEVFRNLNKPDLTHWYHNGVIGISTNIVGTYKMKLAIMEGFMRAASKGTDLSRSMQDICVNALLLALRMG